MMTTNTFPFRRRALVLALMLVTGAAPAAIIDVSGDCTLVAAINNANSDTDTDGAGFGCDAGSGADHLSLATNGLYTLTEVVQGDEDGLPWITSTITINGHGARIARTGGPGFRLLHVTDTGDLTLNSLTLSGGALVGEYDCSYNPYIHICPGPAGILNDGKMTLNNSTLSGNNGASSGAILNSGDMTLNHSSVSGNKAYHNSGILNTGNMTLNHSSVSGNEAVAKNGGISNSGTMQLNDSIISGNKAQYFTTGGIFNSGTMTLSHSTVSKNESYSYECYLACDIWGGDGGITNSGKMILSHSSVSANRGASASGISNSGSLVLTNSTVSSNRSENGRGAIANSGSMMLISSRISNNVGRSFDTVGMCYYINDCSASGHIANSSSMTISNSFISGNSSNYLYGGGGIIKNNSNGTVLLTNSTISGNRDAAGSILNLGAMTLTNITLSNNRGNAIANMGKLKLSHSTLSGNTAAGISNHPGAEIILSNSIIANSEVHDCGNSGILTLEGNNLIEDGSCGAPLSGDPKLAPLLDNGGPTPTHALRIDSPAINAADKNHCVAIDQRNVLRPLLTNAECDLGAFERRDGIPISVAPIMQFFDQQSLNGGITGTGVKGALNRLDAVRNQLFVAGHYKNRNKISPACTQLTRTFKHIDPDNSPDVTDMVTGSAAGQLADQVIALRTEWLCK